MKSVVKNIDVSTWPDSNVAPAERGMQGWCWSCRSCIRLAHSAKVWLLESFKRFVATGQLIRLDSCVFACSPKERCHGMLVRTEWYWHSLSLGVAIVLMSCCYISGINATWEGH